MEQLVLGYDATCGTCVETARSVEEAAEGNLSIVPLDAPDMAAWRETAFGQEAPFTPTLVDISTDGHPKVYTGIKVGFILTRKLGMRRMWRVSTALSSLAPSKVFSGPSRSQVVKGALGVVAGATVLTGTASPASASRKSIDHWLAKATIIRSTELENNEVAGLFSSFIQSSSSQSFVANAKLALNENFPIVKDGKMRGVLHELKNGEQIRATSLTTDNNVILHYELLKEGDITSTLSRIFTPIPDEVTGEITRARMVAKQEDGATETLQPLASGCVNCTGRCRRCECGSYNLRCVARCCGPCAFACGNLWTCLGCVGIWCPLCTNWADPCCTSSYCGYSQTPSCSR